MEHDPYEGVGDLRPAEPWTMPDPVRPNLMRPRVSAAKEPPPEPNEADLRATYGFHDFEADMDGAPQGKTWLEPHLIEESRPIWLGGKWKVGKSLFMLQKALEMALGIPSNLAIPEQDRVLWAGAEERIRVLYLDRENLYQDDVLPRIRSMGYDIKGLSENLLYLSFPRCDPLNTESGARYVRNLVEQFTPDVVVLDSVSSFITGAEKEPETWMRLHQELLIPLRIANVATVMIDHPGHGNDDRNSGSSAKGRIADALWMLKAHNATDLSLTLQWARMPVQHRTLSVRRTSDPLRHDMMLVATANGTQRTTQGAVVHDSERCDTRARCGVRRPGRDQQGHRALEVERRSGPAKSTAADGPRFQRHRRDEVRREVGRGAMFVPVGVPVAIRTVTARQQLFSGILRRTASSHQTSRDERLPSRFVPVGAFMDDHRTSGELFTGTFHRDVLGRGN